MTTNDDVLAAVRDVEKAITALVTHREHDKADLDKLAGRVATHGKEIADVTTDQEVTAGQLRLARWVVGVLGLGVILAETAQFAVLR